MKNLTLILFFHLIGLGLFAQTEQAKFNLAMETFVQHFNQGDGQAVFEMMDDNMQTQLGLDSTKNIISTLLENLGNIQGFTLIQQHQNTEVFETSFERGKQNIVLSMNPDGSMAGLYVQPAKETPKTAKFERNTSQIDLPFRGSWFTFWGGDTKAENYHVVSAAQKHAFDFIIVDAEGKSYQRSGTRNEDYYAFGKPLFAACDAMVDKVITGIRDNKPGTMNPKEPFGNAVVLKTANNEYLVYAHFEQGTIKVKEGDQVKNGQLLGRCGNSGNSSEPHLHFHMQDGPDLKNAVGVKTFFRKVIMNDASERSDYSPVKNDRIRRPLDQ